MIIAHEIRGRLHALRLHLTFVERALAKPGSDPQVIDSVAAASSELHALEQLVLALLAPPLVPALGAKPGA